jgi:hypothetical protein
MLEAEASGPVLVRQVFWLTARNGSQAAFPRRVMGGPGHSGLTKLGSLADHSGGPATDSHRFPFCLSPVGRTCRDC